MSVQFSCVRGRLIYEFFVQVPIVRHFLTNASVCCCSLVKIPIAHVVPCSGIRSMFLTCVACLSRFIQLRACSASCKVRAACVALFIKQRVPLHVRRVVYSFTHSTAPAPLQCRRGRSHYRQYSRFRRLDSKSKSKELSRVWRST